MAKATSPVSGQPYGLRHVCQAWGVPRSSFYAARAPAPESAVTAAPPARRGPKPAITDEALLAAIQRDLETSPWTGEGHRKVWARWLIEENGHLSPLDAPAARLDTSLQRAASCNRVSRKPGAAHRGSLDR